MIRLLLITCLIASSICMCGQPVYVADSSKAQQNLSMFTQVLVDSIDKFAEQDILSGRANHLFTSASLDKNNAPMEYWMRFSVRSASPMHRWYLVFRDSISLGLTSEHDEIAVFFLHEGRLLRKELTGKNVARSERSLQGEAGFSGVAFDLRSNDQIQVYVRIKNYLEGIASFSIPWIVQPATVKQHTRFQVMFSVLCAIASIFCLLSVFFFFFTREKSYLFFALYTFFLSQHYLILHPGIPFIDLYIPEHPHLVHGCWVLLTQGGFILFCVFGRYYMNLPQLSKSTDRNFIRFILVWTFLLIIQIASLMISRKEIIPRMASDFIPFVGVLAFFIRFAFFKSVLARFYLVGAAWLLVFTIMGLLWGDADVLPFNPWPIAQVGQFIIFTIGLAYKVRLNEKARAEANRIQDMDLIKSRFFANISHEFRTPLSLIQGPLQQIETMTGKDGQAAVPLRHINTMRRNTDRLLELVNQLLDLSRLDSGNMKLQIIRGDLVQLLKRITTSYDSLAEQKGIHYQLHFPEGTTIAYFDKDKLEKILTNLLGNAFKYTKEGRKIAVSVTVDEERLRILVEDEGPGIPKKELDKVFDRFYQVEGTEEKGSGIGLALVKELIDLYRGQISVSSEQGKGSRFKVSLPIGKSSFADNEIMYGEWKSDETLSNHRLNESYIPETETSKENSGKPLLLLVEDNLELRQFIVETVDNDYQVVALGNGKEGLEKAIAEIPDIIVSDVMMPVMDGFEFAEKLRKDERTSHIPIILLTAKAGQQHKIDGLKYGADDYMTKPFDAHELLTRMQNLVNQRKLLRKKFAGQVILKPAEITVHSIDEEFLRNIMLAIEKNMGEEEFGVEELAREIAMSRSQLHRKLVALTGQAPSEVLRTARLLRAKELLEKRSATPSEVAFKVGFNSHAYFSKCFKDQFGVSPSEI